MISIPEEAAAIKARAEQERALACAACMLRAPVEDELCSTCGAAALAKAEEKDMWEAEPSPVRTPEPELVSYEHESDEVRAARLKDQSRSDPTVPIQQDTADIAVAVEIHETIKQFGETFLVSGDAAVAALRALETAAATIPSVDRSRVYAATWARFARHQLAPYAAVALAHRLLNGRRIGRHVLKHILASRVLQAPLGPDSGGWRHHMLDTSAIWQRLAEAAWNFLFHYDEGAPFSTRGRLVQNVLGRRSQAGRSSHVGLYGWQRPKLRRLADPSKPTKDGSPTPIFTGSEAATVIETIDAALELFARRWAKRRDRSDRSSAELFELAIRGKLDTAGVAVTEEVVRRIKQDAKKQRNTIHVDAQDLVDGGDAEQFLADLVEQSADRDHLLGLQDIVALDDRQAREAAIERADPYLRRFIVESVKMMEDWELPRDPTVEEAAERLGRRVRYTKALRQRGRALMAPVKEARQEATQPTPATPPKLSPYGEEKHARYLAIVAKAYAKPLEPKKRRRRR